MTADKRATAPLHRIDALRPRQDAIPLEDVAKPETTGASAPLGFHTLTQARQRDRDTGRRRAHRLHAKPRDNAACERALAAYRAQLTSDATFATWTLEDVVAAERRAGAPAAAALAERYLDWVAVDRAVEVEKILEVGLEGGAVTLEGRRGRGGRWEFRIVQDWGTAWELIGESSPVQRSAPWVSSWEKALAVLDQRPWTQMMPLEVHPEFAERIVGFVLAREGQEGRYVDRWRRMLPEAAPLRRRR
jgi:hypothetical protein